MQVSTAVQATTGDPSRFAGQNAFEPDFGVSWLQPGSRFGVFQIEIRGARRGDTLHTGPHVRCAARSRRYRSVAWTIEAGDAYFSPGLGGYGFSNLFTPAVTFNGAAVAGRTERTASSSWSLADDGVAKHLRQRSAGARTNGRRSVHVTRAPRAARAQRAGLARPHIVARRIQLHD